ncbi:uncharacterized protein LOC123528937 [Mercenaria mercenaria]|uniref:uncharacterized protein LOC123528937 n=1 Tax=Mercenaria mercenaria TaxID=6596 RepID=UPI00234E7D87|nr:uncharacterized protein LOC123528937 [Mercenaria mercenaria]
MKKWQGRMEKQIEQIQGYTINYNNLQLIIDEIKQTVFYAKAHLSEFKSQLDILSAGRVFPGLLSPFHLRALLVEIQNQAPKTYALPADPSTDLWKYYQFLRSSTMIAEDKIIINIHVPLIDFNSRFDVYRIHNFELPYSNINRSSIPQSSKVHLVAKYDLEFSALLFNRERTKFAVILPSELESCKSSFTQFCQVRSPFYQASMSELCVTALFLRNPAKVTQNCNIIIKPNTKLPYAENIDNGLWAVTTLIDLRFVIVCQSDTKSNHELVVKAPLSLVQLEMNCQAFNEHLNLSPWYSQISKKTHHLDYNPLLPPNISTNHLWKQFHYKLENFTNVKLPHELKTIKQIPLDILINKLENLRHSKLIDDSIFPTWIIVLIAAGCSITLGIGIFYLL